ncbi:MAG: hypothetical protein JRJ29_07495 [Deltaproteobacteria bacterium]|nr:hypothetical protein [Deltaproteobacteria bacterium]
MDTVPEIAGAAAQRGHNLTTVGSGDGTPEEIVAREPRETEDTPAEFYVETESLDKRMAQSGRIG